MSDALSNSGAATKRPNCFNAVQLFFAHVKEPAYTGPEEFVKYVQDGFKQIPLSEPFDVNDLVIVWSRSAPSLPEGSIQLSELQKDREGYPFGLVIEHAFVRMNEAEAFQKRDPTEASPFEIVSPEFALSPYLERPGYEITKHRRQKASVAQGSWKP